MEDLAKTSRSWVTIARDSFIPIVHACCERALLLPPLSTWDDTELLDTGHAFIWSSWMTARPESGWRLFHAWASQGMVFDAASFGLLLMDSAYSKSEMREVSLFSMMESCSAFEDLKDVFVWCIGAADTAMTPGYAMRFDVRTCSASGRMRGTHAKLSLLVMDMLNSDVIDAATALEAIRQHSYGQG